MLYYRCLYLFFHKQMGRIFTKEKLSDLLYQEIAFYNVKNTCVFSYLFLNKNAFGLLSFHLIKGKIKNLNRQTYLVIANFSHP